MGRAWLLNLDAEAELADPTAHTPSRAVRERARALAATLGELLGPGAVVLPAALAEPLPGLAWCPTPRALAALGEAGAIVAAAPAVEVLRRVNHRRFCAELGQTLPGARYVMTRGEIAEAMGERSPTGVWLAKRPLGFSGRGRLRLDPGRIDAAAERWIEGSLASGEGLQIEPWVERAGDYGLHGHVGADGGVVMGEATMQECDARGAWIASRRAVEGELAETERRALFAAGEETAEALRAAGYFGPFGIDAFRYRDAHGALAWNARCEINARYAMGWAAGMGGRRPDLG